MRRFKNILCVIESEETALPALQRALLLAQNNQAKLSVVKVIPRVTAGIGMPDGGPISSEIQTAMYKGQFSSLQKLVEPYRKKQALDIKILKGLFSIEIIREVMRNEHDLVIKVANSESWLDQLFGSDDMSLLRKCPCPVWLIKPGKKKNFKRILVSLNVDDAFSDSEKKARHALNLQLLELASSLALADFAQLHIAHCWEASAELSMRSIFKDIPEETISSYVKQVKKTRSSSLKALVRELDQKQSKEAMKYLKPKLHLVQGSARKEIPALAKDIKADLIVMGTVARTGIQGYFMGNTAETILGQIHCSVLATKPPGFVSPVALED
jgi:nucleotide-binding universal stress UspA family protein